MLLVGLPGAGCAVIQEVVVPPLTAGYAAYDEAMLGIESATRVPGPVDRTRRRMPTAALLKDRHPLAMVEIGRRFEAGAGGLPRDRTCAAWWYERAAGTPYDAVLLSRAGTALGPARRTNHPQAFDATRKLLRGGPVGNLADPALRIRCESQIAQAGLCAEVR